MQNTPNAMPIGASMHIHVTHTVSYLTHIHALSYLIIIIIIMNNFSITLFPVKKKPSSTRFGKVNFTVT